MLSTCAVPSSALLSSLLLFAIIKPAAPPITASAAIPAIISLSKLFGPAFWQIPIHYIDKKMC